jgi:hypothetical protein
MYTVLASYPIRMPREITRRLIFSFFLSAMICENPEKYPNDQIVRILKTGLLGGQPMTGGASRGSYAARGNFLQKNHIVPNTSIFKLHAVELERALAKGAEDTMEASRTGRISVVNEIVMSHLLSMKYSLFMPYGSVNKLVEDISDYVSTHSPRY